MGSQCAVTPKLPADLDRARPLALLPSPLAYFRVALFLPDHEPHAWQRPDEYLLSVRKHVMLEKMRNGRLKDFVAVGGQDSKPVAARKSIPADVKLAVWTRDGAACTNCGNRSDLQFDHIIPVSRGGSSTEANLRVLCQTCNLIKSDRIGAF